VSNKPLVEEHLHNSQADEAEIGTGNIVSIGFVSRRQRRRGSSQSTANIDVGQSSAGSTP
jgi:hypothetical protein